MLLKAEGLVKRFPGVVALRGVDFELRRGEVHALVGQNGAGKSTLVKILNGVVEADGGVVYVRGERVRFRSPADAKRHGITLVHQEITLVPHLTVAENILLSRVFSRGFLFKPVDRRGLVEEASVYLGLLGLEVSPDARVRDLSVGEQQLVQIARALAEEADVLCLDEPTSALTPSEAERLFKVIDKLRGEGRSVVFITHHIDEVFRVADRVTVLRDGARVATLEVGGTSPYEVVRLMLGRDPDRFYVGPGGASPSRGRPVLVVRSLSTEPRRARGVRLEGVSFHLMEGEVLAVVGLLGSGKTELGKALFGAERVRGGEVLVGGERARIKTPVDALRHGIFYLPENRRVEGLVLTMAVRENIVLSSLKRVLSLLGFRRPSLERRVAEDWVRRLRIVASSVDAKAYSLSGGNQQKVVIAKALQARPRIMIFDEPTMGIDVGAKVEVRRIISRLSSEGYSILLLTSDVDEALALADRVMVLYKGRVVALLENKGLKRDQVIALMSGGAGGGRG